MFLTVPSVPDLDLPAWSDPSRKARATANPDGWACASSIGIGRGVTRPAGVKVAIIDSGVDATIRSCGVSVQSVTVEIVDDEATWCPMSRSTVLPRTACAGIVVGLAPEVEIYSVRVLGADLRGKGTAFLAGLGVGRRERRARDEPEPVIQERAPVPVLSEVVDQAYFAMCAW